VQIQVRVAEASRTAMRSLGINAYVGGTEFLGGSTIGGNPHRIDIGAPEGADATGGLPFLFNQATHVASASTLFAGFPSADFQLFIDALVDNQYMRVLAEPTLVALSGEQASFLAGGEFPIPVVQGSTGTGQSSITIEFKEFGVRLAFRPTVLGDGTIRLKVAPEVSTLSDEGSVEIEGFSVPSLQTRRAETTIEMKSGQTFALAGLIDSQTRAVANKVPGAGEIPIIGALFRSVRYQQEDTELVVLATVSLVEPLSVARPRPLPGDLHDAPSDWELYAGGHIEGRTPGKISPAGADWLRRKGLDRLQGPGAWAPYVEPQRRHPTTGNAK
jgi:pilus assembly protein CpaC